MTRNVFYGDWRKKSFICAISLILSLSSVGSYRWAAGRLAIKKDIIQGFSLVKQESAQFNISRNAFPLPEYNLIF